MWDLRHPEELGYAAEWRDEDPATTEVGGDGGLLLPEETRRRWGVASGARVLIKETREGLLLRRADPPLTRLYLEPTSLCNLSCRTCVRNSWSEPGGVMDFGLYAGLIAGLRGTHSLQNVSFWGFGEPLLHPDIVEMVAMARGLGTCTQLITNGLLLDGKMAQGLVDAGLDSLVVSIDGASPGTYADVRAGGNLDLIRENVNRLRDERRKSPRHNPEIGLEFVAMRRNVGELRHLRPLAFSLGASFIVVTNLLPHSAEMKDEILYGLRAGRRYPSFRSKWSPEIVMPQMDVRGQAAGPVLALQDYSSQPDAPPVQFNPAQGYCRFVNEGTAAVTWDGEVSPCIALMHSYPCYIMGRPKQIRRYSLGSISKQTVPSLWMSEEFVRFRDRVQRFDFSPCSDCGGCDLSDTNEEDCLGNSFPVCGDCLWAKGVIRCP